MEDDASKSEVRREIFGEEEDFNNELVLPLLPSSLMPDNNRNLGGLCDGDGIWKTGIISFVICNLQFAITRALNAYNYTKIYDMLSLNGLYYISWRSSQDK